MENSCKMEKFSHQIEKNYKVNFYANIFDGSFFALGMGFVSLSTILPLFVKQLTDSKFLISLITATLMFGANIPQLFAARKIEGLYRKKKVVLLLGLLQRLPWLCLAILTYVLTPEYQNWLLVIFFVCWGLYSVAGGLVGPAWFDLVSKVIPVDRRGRFFGYRTFLSSILQVLGALGAGYIIKSFNFPFSFTVLFTLAFIALMISYLFLLVIKEPAYPTVNQKQGFREYFKKLPMILKEKVNFRNYLLCVFFIQFIGMSNGLFTVAGIERLGLTDKIASDVVGTFTILLIVSQSLTNIFWGHVSDRYGHKLVMTLCAAFNSIGVLIALFAQSIMAFYFVFIITGIALGAQKVSFLTIIPEFCNPEERPTYVAITNTVSGLTIACVSLLGGLLADLFNYQIVFGISFLMVAIGAGLLLTKVYDPRDIS
ncbi:arabinose efflux permease family protein [Halobacteroides halobius DSM 5150]|uniref:Arabinose efflux permease family protein n=1 Tax=Halobacteroides halobius (strain ATCC 35273 / DSM 5150 / MD-1) TaxID=748449 RepID=L0K5Q9_HALHC|nr:MFS transporter [Halobacteroides halobius]AGB40331.1 arabinose efflux permease family protein [Halobacteroides halobius DSM 5150]